jgi:flagellar motor switch protein FliN/FliY
MTNETASETGAAAMEEFATELVETGDEIARSFQNAAGVKSVEALGDGRNLDVVMRIPVSVRIVLGSTKMPISNLVKLGRGSIIPLDRKVGEAVDIMVNDRVVARGEVVLIDDKESRFGVSLTEVVGWDAADVTN